MSFVREDIKKIGREVLFLHTEDNLPRRGEGTFLRLKNEDIMFAYTSFTGNNWEDECEADIMAVYSSDEGETWTKPSMVLEHSDGATNYMCPSLFRMPNGNVGLLFLRKDGMNCIPYFTYSSDEGKSFVPIQRVVDEDSYWVSENDRAVVLDSGRIVLPTNKHIYNGCKLDLYGLMQVIASDDCGKSWKLISRPIESPIDRDHCKQGMCETVIYQQKDGRLRAMSRTDVGFQLECYSDDRGESWTNPQPNRFFTSPEAPMMMKRVGEYTVAVFNPIPRFAIRNDVTSFGGKTWGRTPLVCAVSDNDGQTFERIYYLETDPENSYCYPAVFDGGDYMLVSYYHSDGQNVPLRSTKMIKIDYTELAD